MGDVLTSLFASFIFVGSLGFVFVLLSIFAQAKEDRAYAKRKTEVPWKPGTWVHRREEPWVRYQVLRPSGPWIRLEGPEGRRLLLSEERFRDDFVGPS